jgi:hypothetical protein
MDSPVSDHQQRLFTYRESTFARRLPALDWSFAWGNTKLMTPFRADYYVNSPSIKNYLVVQ